MEIIPIPEKEMYCKKKWGFCGELGEGGNVKIRFLQTVIGYEELDDITLISNIPGSERWEVRDLFQRDVDNERVTEEILPYFQDNSKVKFFNPLTLIILPIDYSGKEVLKVIDYIEPKIEKEGDQEYEVFEKEHYFKFSINTKNEITARIEWNNSKCFLVAIDGQHRLSALKRWKRTPDALGELKSWKIPVVILTTYKSKDNIKSANLLEVVRRTFVYINSKAIKVNQAREILLNDESVNAICTQELIQFSHVNDNLPLNKRDDKHLPLIFFDWRGETSFHRRSYSPSAVKSIEEVHSWFEHYLLGEDGGHQQEIELQLTDLIPPIHSFGFDQTLTSEDAKRVREQFRKTLLPGLVYFLTNFFPYRKYIAECISIEKKSLSRSDIARHAFMKLRFGNHNAPEDQLSDVNMEYESIVNQFEGLKNSLFPEILSRDIGMRGIMYAFGRSKSLIENIKNKSIDWLNHSKSITACLNQIFSEGWFKSFNDLEKIKRILLTYLVFDESGTIINYRFTQAEDALGAFLLILLFHKKMLAKEISTDDFEEIWNNYSYNLKRTIEKGFRKHFKAEFKESFKGSLKEFNEKVKKHAEKASRQRIVKFAKYLNIE